MTTRVLLLRHAESADPKVFHGAESDVGLSDRGLRQAEAIAQVLVAHRPQVVISSAMRRARITGQAIARACGVEQHLEPLLHERKVGALSGIPIRGETLWPETERQWGLGQVDFAPPGMESFADIRDRVLPVWERVVDRFAGQTLVLVAHGIVVKVLVLSLAQGKSPRDWPTLGSIRNVAISELLLEGTAWNLLRWNELPPELE